MDGLEQLPSSQLIPLLQQALAANTTLQAQVQQLQQANRVLREEIATLRGQQPPAGTPAASGNAVVPAWVKPNTPKREDTPRKKRACAFVRRRQTPTEVRVHARTSCPDCGRALSGGWEQRRRQVIDLPLAPVQIIDHVVLARQCGVCQKRVLPSLDLSGEVVGQHRVGIRLMSLIAWLHIVGRVPGRTIQGLLHTFYGLHLSVGEITQVLHTVAAQGQPAYAALGAQVKASDAVQADETGWREDGSNGYVWSFSTPTLRYYVYDKSRSHEVPASVLGDDYAGVLGSDFYGGYNFHLGLHQRCWVHFGRDLHTLQETYKENNAVKAWCEALWTVYEAAKAFHSEDARQRVKARERFQEQLSDLAAPYARSDCPQRVLAQRCERFLPELFTFVEHPHVPSHNNAAERAVRPVVISRKVSGGTRSPAGSTTKMTLLSLFATWKAQGRDVLQTCQQMLAGTLTPASAQAT